MLEKRRTESLGDERSQESTLVVYGSDTIKELYTQTRELGRNKDEGKNKIPGYFLKYPYL